MPTKSSAVDCDLILAFHHHVGLTFDFSFLCVYSRAFVPEFSEVYTMYYLLLVCGRLFHTGVDCMYCRFHI
jgi:DMSO reductase anchor subunit